MSSRFDGMRRQVLSALPALSLALTLAAGVYPMPSAQAAPARIEPFGADSWSRLQRELPRPAAVIFTTTDCAYCPDAVEQMAQALHARQPRVPLLVVVMDGEGKPDILRDPHYKKVDRLFAFAGEAAPLQYQINPKWRGITPYVALFGAQGAPRLITGRPQAADLQQWLDGAAAGAGGR